MHIETRREEPARVKSEAEALLVRAGYLDASRRLTGLADLTVARLSESVSADPRQWAALGRLVTTLGGLSVAEAESGDISLLICSNCGYGDAEQTARSRKPLPDVEPLLPMERVATPNCHTIESLAAYLGISQERTAKALLFVRAGTDHLVLAIIRGDMQASEAKLQSALGPLQVATPEQILAAGAVPGYASPIGLSGIEAIVDDLIPTCTNLVAGANEAGYHLLNTNYGRDYTATMVRDITLARPGDACPECGQPMLPTHGYVVADAGRPNPPGALLTLAARFHDERGLALPFGLGPFDVYLLHLPSRSGPTQPLAEEVYDLLQGAGIRVLYDDREERAGVKFNDADLIGCPLRITVGEKHVNDRMVEFKTRSESTIDLVPMAELVERVLSLVKMNQAS